MSPISYSCGQFALKKTFPTFLFAKSLFDNREYDYCATVLEKCLSPRIAPADAHYDPLVYFLHTYARYMACEKRRSNDEVELRRVFERDGTGKSAHTAVARCNKEMSALRGELEARTRPQASKSNLPKSAQELDPFMLYINALVYIRLGMEDFAVNLLVRAIIQYSAFWAAWFELTKLVKHKEHLHSLKLPSCEEAWMRYFFEVEVSVIHQFTYW